MKWIWEHMDYPNFKYDIDRILPVISEIDFLKGKIDAYLNLLNTKEIKQSYIDNLCDEIISNLAIEGEYIIRDSVRDSILKQIDFESYKKLEKDKSSYYSDNLVELYMDINNQTALSVDKLLYWHTLFLQNQHQDKDKPILVGEFRTEDISVVEKLTLKKYYTAVPTEVLDLEVNDFISYINNSKDNKYIKAAIAHVWFVIIHPFDDGNGRMSRAIADYVVKKDELNIASIPMNFISKMVKNKHSEYYEALEETTDLRKNRYGMNITPWIKWHCELFLNSYANTLNSIEKTIEVTKFWDKHKGDSLNERQIKVLSKILDSNQNISAKAYMDITKTSKASATRDLLDLVSKNCLVQIENTQGRNIRYKVDMSNQPQNNLEEVLPIFKKVKRNYNV